MMEGENKRDLFCKKIKVKQLDYKKWKLSNLDKILTILE